MVQVLVPLLDAYLRPHPNSAAVLQRLFQRDPAVPVRAAEAVCQREPAMVHYVCSAVQVRSPGHSLAQHGSVDQQAAPASWIQACAGTRRH